MTEVAHGADAVDLDRAELAAVRGPLTEREVRAPLVIGADGRRSLVAREAGVAGTPRLYNANGRGCYFAYWRDGRLSVLHTRPVPARPVYVVSRSHRNPELEAFLAAAPDHEARSRGSSLKFCQIASGEADLYPRTGPTSEWDTAAGQCIAEQAGALVLRLPDLSRLRYNQKASLLNPLFAVIGDSDHDWKPLLATITA